MYTEESLSVYPYFKKLLKKQKLVNVLDSLTGLVLRPYIIEFVQSLVKDGVPFTFAIMDLDNFKFINDTYGHKVGDGVLMGVAHDLIDYLEGFGIAGRFGGDEFLFVNLRDITYDDVKLCYQGIYENFTVLRKNVKLENCSPFITGTVGSATYPTDAQDYDSLFALIDKTLYRGKTKGRNCYIIYVESKHKDIQIRNLSGHGLYATVRNLATVFDAAETVHDKLQATFETLKDDMRINDLFYIGRDHKVRSVTDHVDVAYVPDIGKLMTEEVYSTNDYEKLQHVAPLLYEFLHEWLLETILIAKVQMGGEVLGYLMCAEYRNRRIWQEDECAIMFFAARLLSGYLFGKGLELK
ncbi:MAG: GGDEF domain-containing protein [Lachnospiraceae bacterium]|nr:GGDEF domain-containing protein [Lachnospiraceae bacterium]